MTVEEFDERHDALACQRCGGGPLERWQLQSEPHAPGPLTGRDVVVCTECSALLELLDVTPL